MKKAAPLTFDEVETAFNLKLLEQFRRPVVQVAAAPSAQLLPHPLPSREVTSDDIDDASPGGRKRSRQGGGGGDVGTSGESKDGGIAGESSGKDAASAPLIDKKTLREMNSRIEQGICKNPACKSKSKKSLPVGVCSFNYCFMCCYNNPEAKRSCGGHADAAKKRDNENEMITEALIGEKKRKFRHFEEKLSYYGQTVLIWCTKDFVQNKKWSEDTMAQLKKLERYAARNSRMNSFVGEEQFMNKTSSSSSSSSSSTSELLPNNGLLPKYRKRMAKKYAKVRENWAKSHSLLNSPNPFLLKTI